MESCTKPINEEYLINNNRLQTLDYVTIFLLIKQYSKSVVSYTDKHIISKIVTLTRWHNEVTNMPFDFYYDLVTNNRPEIIKYVKYQYYDLCKKTLNNNGLLLQYIKCQSLDLCYDAYYNNPDSWTCRNKYYYDIYRFSPTIHPQNKSYYDKFCYSIDGQSDSDDESTDDYDDESSDESIDVPTIVLPKSNPISDLGMALTGTSFIQCGVCKNHYNPNYDDMINKMCRICANGCSLEKDLYVMTLNNGLPLNYLDNNIINYGKCHCCGIQEENIFCHKCVYLIKNPKH